MVASSNKAQRGHILLSDGWLVSMDPAIGCMRHADVEIRGGSIVAVSPHEKSRDSGGEADFDEVIDASNMIVAPGFVDCHKHTWQACLRQRGAGVTLAQSFGQTFARIGPLYQAEDVHIGTLLGALAAIDSGTTTLMDWAHVMNSPAHADADVQALRESGIRAIFGYGWPLVDMASWLGNSSRNQTADVIRLRKEVLFDDEAMVTMAVGGRGPELATMEVTRHDLAMARELGIRTSIHMGSGAEFAGLHAIKQMHNADLLGPDLTFIHCSLSSDDELRMVGDAGVSVCVAPYQEQTLGDIGGTPVARLHHLGVDAVVGLSSDNDTNGPGDMFAQMRALLVASRTQAFLDSGKTPVDVVLWPQLDEVLSIATIGGARTVGLEHKVGSVTPGKRADLILVRADAVNLAPVNDPIAALVVGAHPGNVDTVIIDGVVRKRAGRLVDANLDALLQQARASQKRILAEAGSPVDE